MSFIEDKEIKIKFKEKMGCDGVDGGGEADVGVMEKICTHVMEMDGVMEQMMSQSRYDR